MAEAKVADAKLTQYLNEAYAKEKELEAALTAHIGMTTRKPYRKRLEDHLKETKDHARQLERRIKKLGGDGPAMLPKLAAQAAGQAKSLAKGPLHMVRGLGEAEKMLKNAKTEYWNEHEEIATYTAIETLAEAVGDKETAKVVRAIRREEERMANFLEREITQLAKAVARQEIPAAERNGGRTRRRRSTSSSRAGSRSASGRTKAKSGSSRARAKSRSSSSRSRAKPRSGGRSGSRRTSRSTSRSR